MTLDELKPIVRRGKWGIIPYWVGHIKWDYASDQLYFQNNDYKLFEEELKDKLRDRSDLYYIT